MAKFGRVVAAVGAVVAIGLLSGCGSVVPGGGSASVSGSGSASSTAAGPSSSPTSAGSSPAGSRFPRNPVSTAIGDPVTADLCAVAPLSAFESFGYSPAYADHVVPPGCVIKMRKAGQVAFTVYAYGVGSSSFSHLIPLSPAEAKSTGTKTVDGVKVAQYAYLPRINGTCARNVLAQGLNILVFSYTQKGTPDETANCGSADAMAALMARAASKGSAPRLALAEPSVSDLDFCAALRATKVVDLTGFRGTVKPDGVGAGCEISRDADSFVVDVDFNVMNSGQPMQATMVTEGGHVLYREKSTDGKNCKFTSVQGQTSGGYESIAVYVGDSSDSTPSDLCQSAATLTARFLDVAGLT